MAEKMDLGMLAEKLGLDVNEFTFQEDYQRACDKLCDTLRESANYRDLLKIEFVPDPCVKGEPLQAICHFRHVYATVNIRNDNIFAMYKDILRHLDAIANRMEDWG